MNARLRTVTVVCTAVALASFARLAAADDAAKATTTTTTTTTNSSGTKTTSATTTTDAKQQAMMAEMMKLATPGPAHAALKNQVGTWNATVTGYDMGPQPTTSTGTETRQMILGDRFLETHFVGTFMGQPYEGWGLTGYDNRTQQVMEVWADNMNTSWMSLAGTMSADNKVMSCTGMVPGQDGKPMAIRAETKMDSDTQSTYTMYGKMAGKDAKLMQIVYTKAQATSDAQSK